MLGGIAGCLLPFLPGPPLSFAALLIMQLKNVSPFTTKFLLIWAGITIVVTLLDYYIPIYGTKKFGGSSYGAWGSAIGLIVGLFVPPVGIIVGPFVGAFIGEMIASNNSHVAFKAALGSFLGFLMGTLLKLVVCLVMAYYLVDAIINPG
jgi:uncharacterized protein YqgC (DUF456 family)